MIAPHREPKGLAPDTPPIADEYQTVSRWEAERGSAMLRDALLTSMGIAPPPSKPAPKPVNPRRKPECCKACGSPIAPIAGLISHIQAEVAAYYKIPFNAMQSQRRSFDISHPRQIAMYLASELTPKSLPAIGRRFGGRDHTTVIHAIRQVKSRIANDPEVAADVEAIREMLAG